MSGSPWSSDGHEVTWRTARSSAGRATDREVRVVEAVLVAGSEKAAAHRLGLSHSTVKHHLANARSKVGAMTTAARVDAGPAPAGTRGHGPNGQWPPDS